MVDMFGLRRAGRDATRRDARRNPVCLTRVSLWSSSLCCRGKKGNFFLHTNSEAPFGRGEAGLRKEAFSAKKGVQKVLQRINSIGGDALPLDFGWDT